MYPSLFQAIPYWGKIYPYNIWVSGYQEHKDVKNGIVL